MGCKGLEQRAEVSCIAGLSTVQVRQSEQESIVASEQLSDCSKYYTRWPGNPGHTPSSTSNAQQNLSLSKSTILFPSGTHRTSLVSYLTATILSISPPARIRPLTACGYANALSHILFIAPFSHPLITLRKDTLSSTAKDKTPFVDWIPPCMYHRLEMHQHAPQA